MTAIKLQIFIYKVAIIFHQFDVLLGIITLQMARSAVWQILLTVSNFFPAGQATWLVTPFEQAMYPRHVVGAW